MPHPVPIEKFSDLPSLSIVKQLFFGRCDAGALFPYPTPSAEERATIDPYITRLTAFADKHLDPVAIDRQGDIPSEVINGLADLGMLGATIPREYGGLELSQYGFCRAMEVFAGRCGSTAGFLNAHQSIGLKGLILFGTSEQKERWLPDLARGESIAAFALTEPNTGSDAANVQTRAVFDPQKKIYRINGEKIWITNGAVAKVLTVIAQTAVSTPEGAQDRVTAFVVTPDLPGFKVLEAAKEKVGLRGIHNAHLKFDNMEVPADHILGQPGGGLKVAFEVLNYGRITIGACCAAPMRELLAETVAYANERHQFGHSLAAFPLVQERLATMAATAYAIEAVTYLTAGLADRGADVMLEAAIVKVFSTDAIWEQLYHGMQIFGGRAVFTDRPLERMMRDARVGIIVEGSNEVLRLFIALTGIREVAKRLRNVQKALKSPWKRMTTLRDYYTYGLAHMGTPEIPVMSPLLISEAHAVAWGIRRFSIVINLLIRKYGEGLAARQFDIDRLATAVISLYTAMAVLSRLDSELKGNSETTHLAIGKLYCHQAMRRLVAALDATGTDNDAEVIAVAQPFVIRD